MFDSHISGEVPEHRDFIYGTAIPALERMGVKIRVLRGLQTYVGLFTGRITRGPKKGPAPLLSHLWAMRRPAGLQTETDFAVPEKPPAGHGPIHRHRQG